MALEVKINNAEANDGGSGNSNISKVLRGMLRTAYGFANDIPDQVYIFAKIKKINKNETSAQFYVLFRIQEKIYHPENIHESPIKPKKGEWNMSQERIASLHKYLGEDLFNSIIPSLKGSRRQIPGTIELSYNIETDQQCNFFNYGVISENAQTQWENEILSNDGPITINNNDFDYIRSDEEY